MSSKLRIGAEDAKAPIATCGYFNLNQAASTARPQLSIDQAQMRILTNNNKNN